MSGKNGTDADFFEGTRGQISERPIKSMKKLINCLTEKPDIELQILTHLFKILSNKLTDENM